MKTIKFSGRELAVIRAIDFATGTVGAEILVRTRLGGEEALEILNGLMDAGFIETNPPRFSQVDAEALHKTIFETNPAYAHELRKAISRKG